MLPILALFLLSGLFCAALIGISHAFGPKPPPSAAKAGAYECGLAPPPAPTSRVPAKFFLTGILFILFDIEILFLYPLAIAYRDFLASGMGAAVLLSAGLFLALFVYGLWWEIKTKALEWK